MKIVRNQIRTDQGTRSVAPAVHHIRVGGGTDLSSLRSVFLREYVAGLKANPSDHLEELARLNPHAIGSFPKSAYDEAPRVNR